MSNKRAAELILDVYRGKGRKVGTVEYIIWENDDLRIVAIGGSDGVLDWIQNFRAIPWYSPTIGWCHAGFLKSTRKLWKAQRARLTDGKPTLVCGHSKGGAEATHLAAFMCQAGYPPIKLLTFGAPRCGFSGLGRILSKTTSIRCVNQNDPVPSLPPAGFFILRYRHHCPETELSCEKHKFSEYVACRKEWKMRQYRDGL